MKGAQGLIVAAILGSLGVVLNWLYLDAKTRNTESVSFIGIQDGVTINPGEVFEESHLVAVPIPAANASVDKDFVYLWDARNTIVGTKATRRYEGGNLVYRQDYRTPPAELKLAEDERLIWITVDSRSFVPALVDPGAEISFIVPTTASTGPKEAIPLKQTEMIGPFRVGSLGNRLGSLEVHQASHKALVQERQVGIIVKVEGNKLEAKALKLLEIVGKSGHESIGVSLHPRGEKS